MPPVGYKYKRNICEVIGCRELNNKDSNSKKNGITFFSVPTLSLTKWQTVFPYLTSTSRICSRHFDESDVLKGREIGSTFYPYQRWKLKPNALPKYFIRHDDAVAAEPSLPNIMEETCNTANHQTEEFTSSDAVQPVSPVMHVCMMSETSPSEHHDGNDNYSRKQIVPADINTSDFVTNFATFKSLSFHVDLPDCWVWSFNKLKNHIYCICPDSLPNGILVVKTVRILPSQEVSYHVNNRIIASRCLSPSFKSPEDLSRLITVFNSMKICNGIINPSLQDTDVARLPGVIDANGEVRSRKCTFISDVNSLCANCQLLRSNILHRFKNVPKIIALDSQKDYHSLNHGQQLKLDGLRRKVRVEEPVAKDTSALVTQLSNDWQ